MPQAIAEVEQMGTVTARQRLAVLAEVGNVVQSGGEPVIFLLGDGAAARVLALAEIEGKGQLLLVIDVLVAEQQHRIFVHAGLDIGGLLRRQRLSQIDAGDLAEKMRMKLPDRDRHGVSPERGERLIRSILVKNYSPIGRCQRFAMHAAPSGVAGHRARRCFWRRRWAPTSSAK